MVPPVQSGHGKPGIALNQRLPEPSKNLRILGRFEMGINWDIFRYMVSDVLVDVFLYIYIYYMYVLYMSLLTC